MSNYKKRIQIDKDVFIALVKMKNNFFVYFTKNKKPSIRELPEAYLSMFDNEEQALKSVEAKKESYMKYRSSIRRTLQI